MDPLAPFKDQILAAAKDTFARMGANVPFEIEVPSTGNADFAVPCFPLAKVLRKAPPLIAEEAVAGLPPLDLVSRVWADKGYLNFQLDDGEVNKATLGAIDDLKAEYDACALMVMMSPLSTTSMTSASRSFC
jgi:arginyl-tRNA synthetase